MSFPSNFLETSQANAATVARASGQRARSEPRRCGAVLMDHLRLSCRGRE